MFSAASSEPSGPEVHLTDGRDCDSVARVKENQQDLLQIPAINENRLGKVSLTTTGELPATSIAEAGFPLSEMHGFRFRAISLCSDEPVTGQSSKKSRS